MLLSQPTSTLFPYTTLFRSFDLEGARQAARQMQKEHPDDPLGYLLESDALWWRFWCTAAEFKYGMSDARRRAKLPADQDRKSTRLNSSHLGISYAVFCLKKK